MGKSLINYLCRYIRWHVKTAGGFYEQMMLSFDKEIFALFFNLKSMFYAKVRLVFKSEEFVVTDPACPEINMSIRHRRQLHMAYLNGFRKRAELLGTDYFLDQIPFRDGDTVVDCGANVGDLALWFRFNDIKVNYVGFEPSPVEFSCLKKNLRWSDGVELHNVGLWNTDGYLDFYISSEGADSSIIEPMTYDRKIVVPTQRLESYISEPVRCLKLEAEGAEPEIIEGMGVKLSLVEYIAADLGFERGILSESTLVPVVNRLLASGFELVDVSHGRVCALFRNTNFAERDD